MESLPRGIMSVIPTVPLSLSATTVYTIKIFVNRSNTILSTSTVLSCPAQINTGDSSVTRSIPIRKNTGILQYYVVESSFGAAKGDFWTTPKPES